GVYSWKNLDVTKPRPCALRGRKISVAARITLRDFPGFRDAKEPLGLGCGRFAYPRVLPRKVSNAPNVITFESCCPGWSVLEQPGAGLWPAGRRSSWDEERRQG